jgi:hypothetical protein
LGQSKRREVLLQKGLDTLIDRAFELTDQSYAFIQAAEQPFDVLFQRP